MALKGLLNSLFSVQIKMHSAIVDSHTVRLVPKDVGAIEVQTPSIVFTSTNYSTNQNISIKGKVLGRHKINGVSTVGYYENKSHQLRETKTEFEVEIVPWLGWEVKQTYYGLATSIMGCASLDIGTTPETGYGQTFSVGNAAGGNTSNQLTFFLVKPDGGLIACDTDIAGVYNFVANQSGLWKLYFAARTGDGAGPTAHTQSIKLGQGFVSSTIGEVFFSAECLFFVDAGTQSITFPSSGTTSGTMPCWTSFHAYLTAETYPAGGSFTPSGGSGDYGGWIYTTVTNASINWTVGPAIGWGGGTLYRAYGYRFSDTSGLPPYVGSTTTWHFIVGRVTSTTTF